MADERKKRKVRIDQKCNYCDQKTQYIGAIDFNGKIYRACENHKQQALDDMAKAKDENNQTQS